MNYLIKNLFKYQSGTNIKQKIIIPITNIYIIKFSFFISVDRKLKTYNDHKLSNFQPNIKSKFS
jgi:hypothetical protein